MKLFKFRVGVAVCLTFLLFLASCQKDHSINGVQNDAPANARLTGVTADDPALLAKVPMIVSADYLNRIAGDPINQFNARGGTGGTGKPDKSAPSVSINAPLNSAAVSGAISVKVSASDNIGVTMVKFSVNGTSISNTATSPYTFLWNSASVANGNHTLTATAFDAAGNSTAVSIQITTSNTSGGDVTNPTVSITSPTNGAAVSGTVNIQANASDNVGVSSVKFIINGIVAGTDNTAPYSHSWNTANLANGIYTITATATDAAGNSGSNTIQVTINTVVITPPSLPSSVNLMMPEVQNQGGEGSCIAFAVGYAARSCEKYYSTGASSYSSFTNILSPEYLFNQIKTDEYCSSSSLLTALELLQTKGICTWQSMPYSSTNGCAIMPTAAQNAEAANYKISSYSQISTADITAIKTLLFNKHPLVITFTVDSHFSNAAPGFIWRNYSSTYYSGHAVTICGYDDSKNAVKIINSWGTGWGDNGYSWIDYGFLTSLNPSVYSLN